MAIAGAAAVEGTTVHQIIGDSADGKDVLKIGHPSGIFDVEAAVEKQGDAYRLIEASYGRTARRLMEGYVLVPEACLSK
jgi:2-methylaconitate cis-trans-isomerase PrpF